MDVVIGVDSSTQSCTVEVRDALTGVLLGTASEPHPPTSPPVSRQDPASWWDALLVALPRALAVADVDPRRVGAISVAAQCHGLVVLDEAGAPLRPAQLWNDTTSAPYAAAITARYGTEEWMRRVGMAPSAALTITKLAQLASEHPEVLTRVATVMVPHDYLTFKLTGLRTTDRSDAAGTGYFDVHRSRWLPAVLREVVDPGLDWNSLLPEVRGPQEPAGTVSSEVCRRLGLRDGVLVGPGGGDQHLAAVGLGLVDGDVGVSLGTSGVVFSPSRASVVDPLGLVDSVCDATGGYIPLTCTLNAAKVTDTFARILGVDHHELERLALSAPLDAPRPTLVAYLDGERTPRRPDAAGLLGDLTTSTTREGMALAAYEGVVAGLVVGLDALERVGVPTQGTVVVNGGGARSRAYRHVLADMTGRDVELRDAPDATARGACVQASAVLRSLTVTEVAASWRPQVLDVTSPRRGRDTHRGARYADLAAIAPDRATTSDPTHY